MKALVVTPFAPTEAMTATHGMVRRFSLFMAAVATLAERIEVLHIADPEALRAEPDAEEVAARESAHWGRPTTVALQPRRPRRRDFASYYLAGIVRASEQPEFAAFAGPDQARSVAGAMASGPDFVFVDRMQAMMPLLRSGFQPPPVFFDFNDVDHKYRLRSLRTPPYYPGKLLQALQLPALFAAEREAARLSRLTFVCSEIDRRHLDRLGFGPGIAEVPNAVAAPTAPSPVPAAPTMLFLGLCDYAPNADAAERMVRRIFPRIRAASPDARLLIAGPGSRDLPSCREASPGVSYLGFVDNLDTLYAASRVVVCPITLGGGTRLKLIEAAAHARPMVATAIGAEGLLFRDGAEILLRDDDAGFADACLHLLDDAATCARLGAAARGMMLTHYEFAAVARYAADLMRAALAAPA